MTRPIRVRFAPSPTGKLHIGGARTALFNWAFARRFGGKFLLRIEDTDPERSTKEYERAILEGLRWLGLDWDEGPDIGGPHAPYHQMQRLSLHKEYAADLLARGHAYRCFCTRERLEEMTKAQDAKKEKNAYDGRCRDLPLAEVERRAAAGEPYVLRFRVPAGQTRFKDHVRGDVVFDNKEVEDWVMVRSDGNPTYNFVVVCDDIDMEISHVFRGEEHLVNTPKQVLLYQAFGKPIPEFGHLPLMLGTDRKKLSKRTGDTALQDYADRGFPKAAIVNFLCLQGWALDGTTEVFGVEELVKHFDIKDVGKGGSIFDIEKFLWLGGEYIRRESLEELAQHCLPHVLARGAVTEADLRARWPWFLGIVTAERERIRTYGEFAERTAYLFAPDESVAYADDALAAAKKHLGRIETLRAYLDWLRPRLADGVDAAAVRDATKAWVAERGLKMPALFQPLRVALTGLAGGPDLFDAMGWIGAPSTLRRIEIALERLA
ncbi:MAG: glutamate--tRNA ligase [Planctomycetota bacterium]|nr:glutamate--tRNA ligase [Planctomycetota bacterium]